MYCYRAPPNRIESHAHKDFALLSATDSYTMIRVQGTSLALNLSLIWHRNFAPMLGEARVALPPTSPPQGGLHFTVKRAYKAQNFF